jgi:hypothetical protein
MALGEAAGVAASLASEMGLPARSVPVGTLQRELLARGAMLIYYPDVALDDPVFPAVQYFGTRGALPQWEVDLDRPLADHEAENWIAIADLREADIASGMTRREALEVLWDLIEKRERVAPVSAERA